MRGPVLDHICAARPDQWIEHLERCPGLVEQVRHVVDDEVDELPLEFLPSGFHDPCSVGLIDAVIRAYSVSESAFFDELCSAATASASISSATSFLGSVRRVSSAVLPPEHMPSSTIV
jgi:hypothetical protein